MDATTVQSLLAALPNFAIAVWVIWNYQRTISNLLDNQQKLIEQLMALHPPQDEGVATSKFEAVSVAGPPT